MFVILRLGTVFEVMWGSDYKETHENYFNLSDLMRKTFAISSLFVYFNEKFPLSFSNIVLFKIFEAVLLSYLKKLVDGLSLY